MMTRRQAYGRLGPVLLIFALLSLANSVWLPLHKAPDEIAHFQYSRFIAAHGRLPVNYEERGQAGFLSDWPPLYHLLVALATGWSNSTDPPELKFVWESPRFDMVRELLDTKRLANTEDELWPYRGTVLMWHLGRVVSILLSMGTIILAFLTTLEILPNKYRLAIFSAAFIAFVPTFIFISSAMSYESLVGLLVGLYMLIVIKLIKGDDRLRTYIWLGGVMGLAVTAKYATVILPLQAVGLVTYLAWRGRWAWSGWLKRITVTGIAAMVASSWWFLWVIINFQEIETDGLILGLLKPILTSSIDSSQQYAVFILTGGAAGTNESLEVVPESFWSWLVQFFQSFWVTELGDFPLSPSAYIFIGLVGLLGVGGLVRRWWRQPTGRVWIGLMVFQVLLFWIIPLIRYVIVGHAVVSAQGRHILFPIATILPLLMIYGWPSWLSPHVQRRLTLIIMGGLICWSLTQTVRVATFFTPPLPVRTTPEIIVQIPHRLDKRFGQNLMLLGYDDEIDSEANALNLSLFWQSPSYVDEDYRLVVHLVQDDDIRLRWVGYPINGRYPTRAWESWETIRDDLAFPLNDLSPGTYQVQMQLQGADGPLPADGSDTLMIAEVAIPAAASRKPDIALPVVVEGREIIRGLSLWQADPYRELNLPKYRPRMAIPFVWQGQLSEHDRIEWLLVAPQGRVYPAQVASPHFGYFMVGLDWPSGDYRLRVEAWRDKTVVASRETGPLVTIFNERPRVLQAGSIPYPVEANFARRIELLGYDLPARTLAPGQGVPLTLYWQGLRTMGQSYTIFTKLFDDQGQLWGDIERLPADGYSTIYWLENEVVVDSFELPVAADTPSGLYWLNLGLYEELDKRAVSLPLVQAGELSEVTSLTFGPIKIGGSPPGVVLSPSKVQPDMTMFIEFGQPPVILLRGYDLIQAEGTLKITLYWESLAQTPVDWTAFVHLRNRSGETAAQKDGPLGSGRYPTSVWASAEIIADEIVIPLTALPDDDYSLYIGLYDLATGERLAVLDDPDREIMLIEEVPVDKSALSLQSQ